MTLTLLAVAGVVFFGFWALSVIADQPTPAQAETAAEFGPCDTTGCPYSGWIPVTRRDTKKHAEVCAGCWANGEAHGWWVA